MADEVFSHAVRGRLELLDGDIDRGLLGQLVRGLGPGASAAVVADDQRVAEFTAFVSDAGNLFDASIHATRRLDDVLQRAERQFTVAHIESFTMSEFTRQQRARTENAFVGREQAAAILAVKDAGFRLLSNRADFPDARYSRADLVEFAEALDREAMPRSIDPPAQGHGR